MINHLRTLLLHSSSAAPAAGYPGEEFVPLYQPPALPSGLRTAHQLLFGQQPDRALLNYRLRQLMGILHSSELEQFVTALDPRITYLPFNDDIFNLLVISPVVSPVVNTGQTLTLLGQSSLSQLGGQIYFQWTVTVLNGVSVQVTSQSPSGSSTTVLPYTTTAGLSSIVILPGSSMAIQFSQGSGSSWTITALAKPTLGIADVFHVLQSGMSSDVENALFGPLATSAEPYTTFRNLWEQHDQVPYRVGGVVLALGYQLNQLNTSILVASVPFSTLGVTPNSCYIGGNQYTVITGPNVASATSVTIGGVAPQYTFVKSANEIHVSPFPVANAGTVQLQVNTPSGILTAPYTFNRNTLGGTITRFAQAGGINNGYWDICNGNDGLLWWNTYSSPGHGVGKIKTDGTGATAYPITGGINSLSIVAGPGGNLWTIDQGLLAITLVTPQGVVTVTPLPGIGVPRALCVGSDGRLWVIDEQVTGGHGFLYAVTDGNVVTRYSLPFVNSAGPQDIIAGPDGNLWVVDYTHLYKISTSGSLITTYSTLWTVANAAYNICVGSDGNFWVVDINTNKLWIVPPSNPTGLTSISMPGSIGAQGRIIAAGPDGNIWVTDQSHNFLRQITPSGVITSFSTGADSPLGVCQGPDGNLWVTVFNNTSDGAVLRIT